MFSSSSVIASLARILADTIDPVATSQQQTPNMAIGSGTTTEDLQQGKAESAQEMAEFLKKETQSRLQSLMEAAVNGNTDQTAAALKWLVSNFMDTSEFLNHYDVNGDLAQIISAAEGSADEAKGLTRFVPIQEILNQPRPDGKSVLMLAAERGHSAVVKQLLQVLKTPQAINHPDRFGRTALLRADQRGRRETVVAILDRLAQLGRVPGPGALTAVDRSMMEIAGRRGHFEALIGWLPSGEGSDEESSKIAEKELIHIFLAAYAQQHDYPINIPNFDLGFEWCEHEGLCKALLEIAIARGQPVVLNAWLRQSRVVTPDQIKSAMAAWRANLPAAHAVAGSPSTNEVHITAMHDWDFLNEFFIEEQISKLRPA